MLRSWWVYPTAIIIAALMVLPTVPSLSAGRSASQAVPGEPSLRVHGTIPSFGSSPSTNPPTPPNVPRLTGVNVTGIVDPGQPWAGDSASLGDLVALAGPNLVIFNTSSGVTCSIVSHLSCPAVLFQDYAQAPAPIVVATRDSFVFLGPYFGLNGSLVAWQYFPATGEVYNITGLIGPRSGINLVLGAYENGSLWVYTQDFRHNVQVDMVAGIDSTTGRDQATFQFTSSMPSPPTDYVMMAGGGHYLLLLGRNGTTGTPTGYVVDVVNVTFSSSGGASATIFFHPLGSIASSLYNLPPVTNWNQGITYAGGRFFVAVEDPGPNLAAINPVPTQPTLTQYPVSSFSWPVHAPPLITGTMGPIVTGSVSSGTGRQSLGLFQLNPVAGTFQPLTQPFGSVSSGVTPYVALAQAPQALVLWAEGLYGSPTTVTLFATPSPPASLPPGPSDYAWTAAIGGTASAGVVVGSGAGLWNSPNGSLLLYGGNTSATGTPVGSSCSTYPSLPVGAEYLAMGCTSVPGTPGNLSNFAYGTYVNGSSAEALLFGGINGTLSVSGVRVDTFSNATWIANLSGVLSRSGPVSGAPAWSRIPATSSAPPALADSAFAIDSTGGIGLLAGGESWTSTTGLFSTPEAWEFNFTALDWRAIPSLPRASGLCGASAAWDGSLGEFVVIGGATSCAPNGFSTAIYLFNPSSPSSGWQVAPVLGPVAPAPRVGAALAYDNTTGRLVYFGGMSATGQTLNDSWELSFNATGVATWTELSRAGAPPPTENAASTWAWEPTYPGLEGLAVLGGTSHSESLSFLAPTATLTVVAAAATGNLTPIPTAKVAIGSGSASSVNPVGVINFYHLPPGSVSVTVGASGFASRSVTVALPAGGAYPLLVELSPTSGSNPNASLVVRALNATALAPLPNVSVSLTNLSSSTVYHNTTGTSGDALYSVAAGVYQLSATIAGYHGNQTTLTLLSGQAELIVFEMVPLPTLLIRVLGQSGSGYRPVPGAYVGVSTVSGSFVTNASGVVRTGPVPTGPTTVNASAMGYQANTTEVTTNLTGVTNVTIELLRAPTLEIIVVNGTDSPIPDATVFLNVSSEHARNVTNGFGVANVSLLEVGPGSMAAVASGYYVNSSSLLFQSPLAQTHYTITLTSWPHARLEVVAAPGAPKGIPSAVVTSNRTSTFWITDANGTNVTGPLPAEPTRFSAVATGYYPNSTTVRPPHTGLFTVQVNLTRVPPALANVSVHVVSARIRAPIAGASVVVGTTASGGANPYTGVTNAAGWFNISKVPTGASYSAYATSTAYLSNETTFVLARANQTVNLTLVPFPFVNVTVQGRNLTTGGVSPLSSVQVEYYPSGEPGAAQLLGTTASNGVATGPVHMVGPVSFAATPIGYAPGVTNLTVAAYAPNNVTLTLRPLPLLSVRVVSFVTGLPVALAAVSVEYLPTGPFTVVHSNLQGYANVTAQVGTYRVNVTATGYQPNATQVNVVSDLVTHLRVVLTPLDYVAPTPRATSISYWPAGTLSALEFGLLPLVLLIGGALVLLGSRPRRRL